VTIDVNHTEWGGQFSIMQPTTPCVERVLVLVELLAGNASLLTQVAAPH
jgi:hypothetical protein